MKNKVTAAYVAFVLAGMGITGPLSVARADDARGTDIQKPGGNGHPGPDDHQEWAKKFGLSVDQQSKLKANIDAERAAMKPLRDKERDSIKKLADQVKSKALDKDIQATLDEMKATHKTMEAQADQFRDQREAFLTPSQRAQMFLGRMNHMKHDMHEWKGKHKDGGNPDDTDSHGPPDDPGSAAQ